MNNTIVDIETHTPKLHDFQKVMIQQIQAGTTLPPILMAARGTGKSMIHKILKNNLYGAFAHIKPPKPELQFDEGRVHGARYHTVRPLWHDWPELEAWCRETFGEPGDVWPKEDFTWPENSRWLMNNGKFWFRHEKDRDWFVMRWQS